MPKSLLFFAFAAIIYLLQLWPYTGVGLMIFAASAWPILTVNAGFGGIALEATTGRVHPAWLVLPLAWFAGYVFIAYQSQAELSALDARVRMHNADKRLVIDGPADAYALVFSDSPGEAKAAVSLLDIPVAYETDRQGERTSHIAYRLTRDDTCDRLRNSRVYRDARYFAFSVSEDRDRVEGICGFSRPEDPALPVVTITESKVQRTESLLLQASVTTLTVRAPSGEQVELLTGSATALGWFPMPVFGCGLNSAQPSWDCFYGFMRTERRPLGPSWGDYIWTVPKVAEALDLVYSPASTRRSNITSFPLP